MKVEGYLFHELEPEKQVTVGEYRIIPFDVQHDVRCFGFLINHSESGTILFATDTFYLKHLFDGLNNILIEANYRRDILDKNVLAGRISAAQRNRTLQSHMSFETCLTTLMSNDLSEVNNIVLIHLSNENSDAEDFQNKIGKATGKTVYIAQKGLNIEFNKTPF
jgi:phosphoribosyl 1,2-cyclic phosphodiesterase